MGDLQPNEFTPAMRKDPAYTPPPRKDRPGVIAPHVIAEVFLHEGHLRKGAYRDSRFAAMRAPTYPEVPTLRFTLGLLHYSHRLLTGHAPCGRCPQTESRDEGQNHD
jgi:hypothetical protein